jgi:hypothetical protein
MIFALSVATTGRIRPKADRTRLALAHQPAARSRQRRNRRSVAFGHTGGIQQGTGGLSRRACGEATPPPLPLFANTIRLAIYHTLRDHYPSRSVDPFQDAGGILFGEAWVSDARCARSPYSRSPRATISCSSPPNRRPFRLQTGCKPVVRPRFLSTWSPFLSTKRLKTTPAGHL